jgi:hypothetical protein
MIRPRQKIFSFFVDSVGVKPFRINIPINQQFLENAVVFL